MRSPTTPSGTLAHRCDREDLSLIARKTSSGKTLRYAVACLDSVRKRGDLRRDGPLTELIEDLDRRIVKNNP